MKEVKLKDLKKGEWFTRKPIENPKESQVWIKDFYVRSEKKYCCIRWTNINIELLLKGDTMVYVDFNF